MEAKENKKPKLISKRVLSFTENTFDDGSKNVVPKTDDFTDFELIGLLAYFKDSFTITALKGSQKEQTK